MKPVIKQLLRERLLTRSDVDIRQITDFVNFAKEFLGITDDIKIELAYDKTPDLTTYAFYEIGKLIKVYAKDRNSGDLFRSLGHELCHHKQFIDGRLTNPAEDGKDGTEIENEANAISGILVRRYGRLHPEIYI